MKRFMNLTLRSRLLLSFVVVLLFTGFFSALLGIGLIHRTLPQVKDVLEVDLNAAREIYRGHVARIEDQVRLTAQQRFVRQHIEAGDLEGLAAPLETIRQGQGLDLMILATPAGEVLLRVRNPGETTGVPAVRDLARQAAQKGTAASSSAVFSGAELLLEDKDLVERARIAPVANSYSRPEVAGDDCAGLVALSGAPVLGSNGRTAAVLVGGQLLNRNQDIVDRVRNNLYRQEKYEGRDVAVVALFLGDRRIATSITTDAGDRAVGTLVSSEVYDRVVGEGKRWIDRGHVIDDWYLTAYEPMRDSSGRIIGMLGLGLLEQKFTETARRSSLIFVGLTVAGVLLAALISFLLSNSIMRPVNQLISATEKIAAGASLQNVDLDHSPPEIAALGSSFNRMLGAIRERDRQLHRQTHEKLMRSDRLAMVGQLAAGVAHEINNPLGSILLFSRLVMQQVPPDGRVKENLDRIEKETKRCHSIVQSLLDFARQREPRVEPVDPNGLLDSTLKLFESQYLFHNVEVVRRYAAGLPTIPGDQGQLQQVFMNIILNAVDAMNGKGRLTVETAQGEQDDTVEISVSDTGCGIPPENIIRIFDPFFTTKGVGHGTGLGLSVSYGIVQKHNGDLSVVSTPGKGSTFVVSLPRHGGQA